MPTLRPFQADCVAECYQVWGEGPQNIVLVAPTGAGKTVMFSKILSDEPGASIAIAHRQELVAQISMALARNGVRHRIVGAKRGSKLVRIITSLQLFELGNNYLDPTARCGVGGVDTIVKMQNEPWFSRVRLQIQDEGHHVLKDNKWGRAALLFPSARGLFPTATPLRADGRGLGRHHDGLADRLVLAPEMRDLIGMGYLADYKMFVPPNNFHRENIRVSDSTGELVKEDVIKETNRSCITGDVVDHYLRHGKDKLGVTFDISVEEAHKTCMAYRARGVAAEVLSGETDPDIRSKILRRFAAREITQIVSVDIMGEGFDLPALEVVSMKRPTESLSVFRQQLGRMLRPSPGKSYGILIDHVGNIMRMYEKGYGLPDSVIQWSLDRREKRAKRKSDAIPLKVCVSCFQPYEAVQRRCPYCDYYPIPTRRDGPEFVDGDLMELDEAVLARLRGEIARKDGDFYAPQGLSIEAQRGARKHWLERQDQQRGLRDAIAWWAGLQHARGRSESESYRLFYHRFGTDVANAQLLGAREAEELSNKIHVELSNAGVVLDEASGFNVK